MVTPAKVQEVEALVDESAIVVHEPKHYPWPENLPLSEAVYGEPAHSATLFRQLINIAKLSRNEFEWIVFYNNSEASNLNAISAYPSVIEQMERLFKDELGTPYTEPQEYLIRAANTVVIAVHKQSKSIAAYCCNRFLPKNESPGIPIPISFGCHEIIAEGFQGARLGSLLGALICSYGHAPHKVFSEFAVATRTNNKYIYGTFRAFGVVKRSDRLSGDEPRDLVARNVVTYMQTEVFGIDEAIPFDKPIPIQHEFEQAVTIEGVGSREIIYAVSFSTLAKATLRLLLGPLKRRTKR